jgi:hypothetical protein
MSEQQRRIDLALKIAVDWGGIDEAHHLKWTLDQMVRALTGCPIVPKKTKDANGAEYTWDAQGESPEYKELVALACAGDDGPETYSWDVGIPP